MIIHLLGSDVELKTDLSPIEYCSLVDIQSRGDIHCSIMVKQGTLEGVRAGFIPIEDIDHERTMKSLENPDQLPLVLL